jgi:prepilin-type N-terminal cleavage/methylation domain-containing protein
MKESQSENGFSLIEMTVVLMVLTVVMGVAFLLLNRFQQNYRYEESYADAQRNARFAMARLNEVIRSAGTNPTANMAVNPTNFVALLPPTVASGTAITSSSIQLRSDLNGDKLNTASISADTDVIVTSENVTIRFDATNRRIMMDDNTVSPATSITLADHIRSVTFTDINGASNTNKAIQVRLVAIPSGISDTDPRYREVSYTGVIRLRNR